MEDDEASVVSVAKLDQVTFWTVTSSFMFKLVAMGVTIFILPFNEWIVLEQPRTTDLLVIRGISGSDCALPPKSPKEIECIRWSESPETRESFWKAKGIPYENIAMPSTIHQFLYNLLVLQIVAYLVDLIAVFVMCCNYKSQKDGQTREKKLSLFISALILLIYLTLIFTIIIAKGDFLNAQPPFESCLGTAFRLSLAAMAIFLIGVVLVNMSRLLAARSEGKPWKAVGDEFLFCLNNIRRGRSQAMNNGEQARAESVQLRTRTRA